MTDERLFGVLTSTSSHKLPYLSSALRTVHMNNRAWNPRFALARAAGQKTRRDFAVFEQPIGIAETVLGSKSRRDALIQSFRRGDILPSITRAFGADWKLEGNEDRTVFFSCESGLVGVKELRRWIRAFASEETKAYESMVRSYELWKEYLSSLLPDPSMLTQALVLPTIEDLSALIERDPKAYVDTGYTGIFRVGPHTSQAIWTPAVVVPGACVERTMRIRDGEDRPDYNPDILFAHVLKAMIDKGASGLDLSGIDPNRPYDAANPHYHLTNGLVERGDTIQIGFEALLHIAIESQMI